MGKNFKLDGLIVLVKHAIWADSLYFLCLLLFSTSKILASAQPLRRHVGLILILLRDPL
jgi:hypothetical protein